MLSDFLGTRTALLLGVIPVLGILWAPKLGRVVEDHGGRDLTHAEGGGLRVLPRIWMPILSLLLVTAAGGAVLTFAPQFVPDTGTAMAALFAVTGVAALARWAVGPLADRFGTRPFIWSLLVAAALGVAGVALGGRSIAWLLAGAAVLGLAYGALQTVTLVRAYADGGEANRPSSSVAWNVGFDVGTGLGAMVIGALAGTWSFGAAFWATAAACAAAAVVVGAKEVVGRAR